MPPFASKLLLRSQVISGLMIVVSMFIVGCEQIVLPPEEVLIVYGSNTDTEVSSLSLGPHKIVRLAVKVGTVIHSFDDARGKGIIVDWSVDDDDIVTLYEDGNVQAISSGNTTIHVSAYYLNTNAANELLYSGEINVLVSN